MSEGEAYAWERLADCDPEDVCARAAVEYSAGRGYVIPLFGFPVIVDPAARTMAASAPQSEFLLTKLGYFSRLSILYYLLGAQKVAPTGRLVKPTELKSGQFFSHGSHVLPLEALAARFASGPEEFIAQGVRFHGAPRDHGDAAVEFLPFPRVPITLILWAQDEEFPARSYLLFDATCELQLPADILWSVAMMCTLLMLRG